jgi:hypothetical protein
MPSEAAFTVTGRDGLQGQPRPPRKGLARRPGMNLGPAHATGVLRTRLDDRMDETPDRLGAEPAFASYSRFAEITASYTTGRPRRRAAARHERAVPWGTAIAILDCRRPADPSR